MLGLRLGGLVGWALLGACSGGNELFVDLRTDLVPGVEVNAVEVSLDGVPAPAYIPMAGVDLVRGVRIASIAGVSSGAHRLEAVIVRGVDRSLRRPVVITVSGNTAVTIVVTRNCRGVSCPGTGDDTEATACLGGRCVVPGCTLETPELCPEPECVDDSDCVPMAACAEPRCVAGACLYADSSACSAGEYCAPELGCRPREMADAAMPDAAVDSGTLDAADTGRTDAGGVCTSPRLRAHWPLDETSGSTVADVAGGSDGRWTDSNDDDVSGEATVGRLGGAFRFGIGRSVFVPGFVVPAEGTFSAWLLSNFDDDAPPPGGQHPMVIDAPTPRTTISFADTGQYTLRTNDVSWQAEYDPTADFSDWFHLAATWSATGAQLYVDGVPVGTAGVADARSTSPAGLYIGTRASGARWWDGLIDDVRIYDYAMSPAEVAELHDCP